MSVSPTAAERYLLQFGFYAVLAQSLHHPFGSRPILRRACQPGPVNITEVEQVVHDFRILESLCADAIDDGKIDPLLGNEEERQNYGGRQKRGSLNGRGRDEHGRMN